MSNSKLIHVWTVPSPCGISKTAWRVARYLREKGYNIKYINFLPLPFKIQRIVGGRKEIIHHGPAMNVENLFTSFYIGEPTADQIIGSKIKYLVWMPYLEGRPYLRGDQYVALKKKVDVFIAPSKYVCEKLEEIGFWCNDVKIPGVDPPEWSYIEPYYRAYRARWSCKFVFLYIAHNQPRKAFDKLIEATKILMKEANKPFMVYLFTNKAPRDYPRNVFVVDTRSGHISEEEIWGMLHAADVYVHAAMAEGLGIPIIEALYAGTPVVCLDAPPMNELVNSEVAITFPWYKIEWHRFYNLMWFEHKVYDPKELAEAMAKAMERKWDRRKIREFGKRYYYKEALRGIEKYFE